MSILSPALPSLITAAVILTGAAEPAEKNRAIFSDRAQETGLDFVHFNGMSGEFYYCEMVGGGGALFDYDNDGDLDAYIVQGRMLGAGKTLADAIIPPASSPLQDRLYRNDLVLSADGTTRLRFTDVTGASGLQAFGYGMGAAAADFNNDGWVDLYVMNFGPNQMFQNNGDGTFQDVTQKTGTGNENWGSERSFLDYDRDGWLDLFSATTSTSDSPIARSAMLPAARSITAGPWVTSRSPTGCFETGGTGPSKTCRRQVRFRVSTTGHWGWWPPT